MEKNIALTGGAVLVVLVCCLIKNSAREKFANWLNGNVWRIWLLPISLLAYNLILMKVTHTWQENDFMLLVGYFAAPTLAVFFYSLTPFGKEKSNLVPLIVILLLWLPVELKFVFQSWKVGGASYPFITACAIIYVLLVLTAFAESKICLTWHWSKDDLKLFGKTFLLLTALIVPVALFTGFIKCGISPSATKYPYLWPLVLVAIWFAPALAEELIFRAGIQNTLIKWFGEDIGWVAASLIFGLSHANNKTRTREVLPNWEYVFFATIAGFAYGWVYKKRKAAGSRNALGTSALLHALVDFTWVTIFAGE